MMSYLFLIFIVIGWIISFAEARIYSRIISQLRLKNTQQHKTLLDFEQTIQRQANSIEFLNNEVEGKNRFIESMRKGDRL